MWSVILSMTMRSFLFAAMALVVLGASVPVSRAVTQGDELEGRWLTGKRGVAVTFFRCGEATCGRIDWLAKPRYRGGELKIDRENPNPALRERPWCGIDVISGLRQEKPGVWTDGNIYNPKDGGSYDMEIERQGDGLRVYAFLGLRLLGKKENWIRAPADLPGCAEN